MNRLTSKSISFLTRIQMPHTSLHPYAGKVARIKSHVQHFQWPCFGGSFITIQDWHDRIAGKSWRTCVGNPAAVVYSMRTTEMGVEPTVPQDDEVIYGHVKSGQFSLGHLVHISELEFQNQ